MATTVNKGSQDLSFAYREQARAKYFNKILTDLLPYGIYEGGLLTRVNNYTLAFEPSVVYIKSNDTQESAPEVGVRAETTTAQNISIESGTYTGYCETSKPYIVLRFTWSDQEDNYMDMIAVGFSDDPAETDPELILPYDLVVGKVQFVLEGGANTWIIDTVEPFDYTRRDAVALVRLTQDNTELMVSPSETTAGKVYVSGSIVVTSKGVKTVSGGNFPTASTIPPTTLGRIDLVWVDENGVVQIDTSGVDASSPAAPTYGARDVIAEIRRGASRTTILGSDIFMVKNYHKGTITASQLALVDSGAYFTTDNLESALQQLGQYIYVTISTSLSNHIAAGVDVGDVHNIHIIDTIGFYE